MSMIDDRVKIIIDDWSKELRDIVEHASLFHKVPHSFDYLIQSLHEGYEKGKKSRVEGE